MRDSEMEADDRAPAAPLPPAAVRDALPFEEAYLRFAPRLRKIATAKFNIPRTEAETLVHDVFATYLVNASSVRALEPYLVGAICNASRHYLRRSGAADAIFCGDADCATAPGEDLLAEVERKLLVSRLLARVGVRCRELLHRYYVKGETTQSIADGLDSTPGSILVSLHHCRKRARAAFQSVAEKS